MMTCSLSREEYDEVFNRFSMHLFLQGEWSAGTEDTAILSWWRNVRLNAAVLVGRRFCDRYDEQGEPGPITIG